MILSLFPYLPSSQGAVVYHKRIGHIRSSGCGGGCGRGSGGEEGGAGGLCGGRGRGLGGVQPGDQVVLRKLDPGDLPAGQVINYKSNQIKFKITYR